MSVSMSVSIKQVCSANKGMSLVLKKSDINLPALLISHIFLSVPIATIDNVPYNHVVMVSEIAV